MIILSDNQDDPKFQTPLSRVMIETVYYVLDLRKLSVDLQPPS